jgi:hypothetical protein
MGQNGWQEYEKLVLYKLETLAQAVDKMSAALEEQKLVVESLKLKTGWIATIAGFISAIGFNLGKLFIER